MHSRKWDLSAQTALSGVLGELLASGSNSTRTADRSRIACGHAFAHCGLVRHVNRERVTLEFGSVFLDNSTCVFVLSQRRIWNVEDIPGIRFARRVQAAPTRIFSCPRRLALTPARAMRLRLSSHGAQLGAQPSNVRACRFDSTAYGTRALRN